MRGPVFAGVLAGLLVVLIGLSAFVAMALGRPDPVLRGTPAPSAQPSFIAGSPPASPSPSALPSTPTPTPSDVATIPGVSPTPSGPVGLEVGDRAPGLAMAAIGGNEIDTSELEGQPLWVNFMATWCPPCIDELPVMQRMQRQLEERMTILVVDVGEPETTVAGFMTSLGIDLPVGLDIDGTAQRAWGAYALPVHYWIDADGRVGDFLYGGAGPEQFIEGIRTVLPDAELEP